MIVMQYFIAIGSYVSPNLVQTSLNEIRWNLPEQDVYKILGDPIEKKDINSTTSIWIYASQGYFGIGGVSAYVVIKNNTLDFMEIKNSFDYGFYVCAKYKCGYIDQILYEKLIPREERF